LRSGAPPSPAAAPVNPPACAAPQPQHHSPPPCPRPCKPCAHPRDPSRRSGTFPRKLNARSALLSSLLTSLILFLFIILHQSRSPFLGLPSAPSASSSRLNSSQPLRTRPGPASRHSRLEAVFFTSSLRSLPSNLDSAHQRHQGALCMQRIYNPTS